MTVRASDPLGASDTIALTIHVTDVNEKPEFAGDTDTLSFAENTPPGQGIGEPMTATDPEDDPLTYSLEGTDTASFDIDAQTGQLKTKAGVFYDYETRSSYSVTVRATDSLDASDTIALTIRVMDVDEKPATPAGAIGESLGRVKHQSVGELDSAGQEWRPAAHRLRRRVSPRHEWGMDSLVAHWHHHHDHGAHAAHRLSGSGAGAERRVAE